MPGRLLGFWTQHIPQPRDTGPTNILDNMDGHQLRVGLRAGEVPVAVTG